MFPPHTHRIVLTRVCVFSWRPQRSTGPAGEAACRPCSSSWIEEPSSPPETRLVEDLRGRVTRGHNSCSWFFILKITLAPSSGVSSTHPDTFIKYSTLVFSWHFQNFFVHEHKLLFFSSSSSSSAAQYSSARGCEDRTLRLCRAPHSLWSRPERQRQSKHESTSNRTSANRGWCHSGFIHPLYTVYEIIKPIQLQALLQSVIWVTHCKRICVCLELDV